MATLTLDPVALLEAESPDAPSTASPTPPPPLPRRTGRWRLGTRDTWSLVQRGIFVVGVVLRVRQYFSDRSLWGDEAKVALDVSHIGYAGLTAKLPILQSDPFGWLWLERACDQTLGSGELSLRLPALIGGILLMRWMLSLVRRHLSAPAGALALLLVAVSPSLVYFSSEVKPYGLDAAVLVGLLVVASRPGSGTPRGAIRFAAFATLGVLFSFTAVFVGLAVTAVSLVRAGQWRDRRTVAAVCAGACMYLSVFAVEWFRSLRPMGDNPTVKSFWAAGFPPKPFGVGSTLQWLVHDGYAVGRYPIDASVPIVVLALVVTGLFALWRSGLGPLAAVAGGIVALLVVAALFSAYPMLDRLVVFVVPLAAFVAAAALDVTARRGTRLLLALAVIGAWFGSFTGAGAAFVHPYTKNEYREAIVYAHDHSQHGDQIWVEQWANAMYVWYAPLLHIPIQHEFEIDPTACTANGPNFVGLALALLKPGTHLWLVFAVPLDVPIDVSTDLAAFKAIGRFDGWHQTSAKTGAAEYTVASHEPTQIHVPTGCLLLTPPGVASRG